MGRKYQSTVIGVDAANLSANALLARFRSDADNNFTNYNNPKYDEVFDKANAASTDEEATKYFKECAKILNEDAANVYIQDLPDFVALNKKIGYNIEPTIPNFVLYSVGAVGIVQTSYDTLFKIFKAVVEKLKNKFVGPTDVDKTSDEIVETITNTVSK